MNSTRKIIKYGKLDTCPVPTVKYNDREYRVQKDKNGFEYIKVSQDGKRKIISLKSINEVETDEEFDYIFNFGWRDRPNPELNERIKRKLGHRKTLNNN